MTKTTQIITAVILALLILAAALFGLARSRGIVTFDGWKPKFSLAALTNPMPSLDRPITFPADFPESGKDVFNAQVAELKGRLRNNAADVSAWLDLAIHYRMVGDQEGAVEIWKYIAAVQPEDAIALHNLGEYYFHNEKDYSKAEDYFLRSIAIDPKMSANYTDLFDMYFYVYKQDTSAAEDILRQGIVAIDGPGSIDLMIKLGEYYANKGDSKSARTWYTDARTAAQTLKNTALVRELDRRLSLLK